MNISKVCNHRRALPRHLRALAMAAAGLLALAGPAGARPDASGKPEMPVKMPSPVVLLDKEAISIGVVTARLEDEGVRSMLKTAWTTIQASGLSPGNIFSFISGMLSQSTQVNLLLDMLPVQAVRVVYLDAQGRQTSAFMVTMEGYQGFQGLYWPTLLVDPSGKPYPIKSSKEHTFVIRPMPG